MKKFFVVLWIILVANVAHAAEDDPYFAWEIENPAAYQQHDLLFKASNASKDNGIVGMRDMIYNSINEGEYYEAAKNCEFLEIHQKIAFGTDYFDAGLTELIGKLYYQRDIFQKFTIVKRISKICPRRMPES